LDKPFEFESDEEIQDETSNIWTVSYADFLMVLLTFFILFFFVNTQVKNSVVKSVASAFPQVKKEFNLIPKKTITALDQQFHLSSEVKDDTLILTFPDNSYEMGKIYLNDQIKGKLSNVLKVLEKNINKIEIIFVGHTDSVPVIQDKKNIVEDNYDLSVLRASKALQFALHEGILPSHVAAKGAAEVVRNSRTLSMIIRPYQGKNY